jgi:hypothetical protein
MTFFMLYVTEAAILLILLSLYRIDSKPDLTSFASSLPGVLLIVCSLVVVFSITWIVRTFRAGTLGERKPMIMALGMNIFTLMLTIGSVEMLVRLLTVQAPAGPIFLGKSLYPRLWTEVVARHRVTLGRMTHESTYIVPDPVLGWTSPPNRRDSTGLYISSLEGIRSPKLGLSFADPGSRLSRSAAQTPTTRIAVIGDSMAYGHEVKCEDSWGHVLEERLGPDVQLLNFAVSGYGVNQALLKYQKDVRPWHPKIVLIGVTSEMLWRMMSVYEFLIYPQHIDLPFARPRLIIEGEHLRPIFQLVPSPKEIFTTNLLTDLPHLHQDRFYSHLDWERRGLWRILEASYVFRFLNSVRRPSADYLSKEVSASAMAVLSQRIFRDLLGGIQADGGTPLIVHFPYKWELRQVADRGSIYIPLGVQLLRNAGVDFYDATPCLLESKVLEGFEPGGHYSPPANARIAECLLTVLETYGLKVPVALP